MSELVSLVVLTVDPTVLGCLLHFFCLFHSNAFLLGLDPFCHFLQSVFPPESLPAPSLPVFFFCSLGEVPIESHSGIKLPSGAVILFVFRRIFFAFVLVLSI